MTKQGQNVDQSKDRRLALREKSCCLLHQMCPLTSVYSRQDVVAMTLSIVNDLFKFNCDVLPSETKCERIYSFIEQNIESKFIFPFH